ncbi:MAG: hypothetical protein ACHBNF_14765 [Chromatiales bacterium]
MTKQGAAGPSALPVERAFVLQFRPEADIEQGPFRGRVEHVQSGQAARFGSLEELLEFLGRVLREGAPDDGQVNPREG